METELTLESHHGQRDLAGNWPVSIDDIYQTDVRTLHDGEVYCLVVSFLSQDAQVGKEAPSHPLFPYKGLTESETDRRTDPMQTILNANAIED